MALGRRRDSWHAVFGWLHRVCLSACVSLSLSPIAFSYLLTSSPQLGLTIRPSFAYFNLGQLLSPRPHPHYPSLALPSFSTCADKLPCCCADAGCTTCVQTSESYVSNQCVIRLNVTSRARVKDWMCRQASSLTRTPDLQITMISGAIIFAGLLVAVGFK